MHFLDPLDSDHQRKRLILRHAALICSSPAVPCAVSHASACHASTSCVCASVTVTYDDCRSLYDDVLSRRSKRRLTMCRIYWMQGIAMVTSIAF